MPLLTKEFIAEAYRKQMKIHGRLIGREHFSRETGISENYWKCVHWPTRGAFQRELGFVPNELKRRVPDEVLLRELATLALRLDKLPTQQEMIQRKKEDPSLPCFTGFNRLGRSAARLVRLAAYCEGRPEFAPVARMLGAVPH